ncbi:probable tetraacyldisaccharide 4'-kinase, mitochondrial isoform X1 [Juglans microcarpa x Juglans regia]|uniref:probable tetraacyldisaccharide 4'-kinase, mitochondrial isoform X1 n=1 Tax=Juglans microcarpa x Juglans regia TaxID=2249226 RepID=UPI001B7E05D2|nr:probable tetraacyldisaccharide 4'-kinase, mitochondrial isoform X1 [Juglans microcarpa x Juglans regia]
MEKLRVLVSEIAYARNHTKLSPLQRSLIPVLSFASSLYGLALSLRHYLYHLGIFRKHRLPVPVISVGNLTWGGNGKTPMVEFIARWLADSGISPLILTRGYAGGDEARMLGRHLLGGTAKIGVGANRAAVAASYFEKYGYVDPRSSTSYQRLCLNKVESHLNSEKVGAVILDDGMQHWSLHHDLEIVMVNGLVLWGSCHLLPLGPLREPLTALKRADVAVIHHADTVSEQGLKDAELMIREVKESLPIFYTRMTPSNFFEVSNINSKLPLGVLCNAIILCVSAIGSANAFVNAIEKIGASFVDRLDFSDHHIFQARDVDLIRRRLEELEDKFGSKPVVVVTEKDYDRDTEIFKGLHPSKVLVLCSALEFLSQKGCTEKGFKKLLEESLRVKLRGLN